MLIHVCYYFNVNNWLELNSIGYNVNNIFHFDPLQCADLFFICDPNMLQLSPHRTMKFPGLFFVCLFFAFKFYFWLLLYCNEYNNNNKTPTLSPPTCTIITYYIFFCNCINIWQFDLFQQATKQQQKKCLSLFHYNTIICYQQKSLVIKHNNNSCCQKHWLVVDGFFF